MVSFSCESCQDTVKKPKLEGHASRCWGPFTCIDCNITFQGRDWKNHTSCITEEEKYQKGDMKEKGQKKGGMPQKVVAAKSMVPHTAPVKLQGFDRQETGDKKKREKKEESKLLPNKSEADQNLMKEKKATEAKIANADSELASNGIETKQDKKERKEKEDKGDKTEKKKDKEKKEKKKHVEIENDKEKTKNKDKEGEIDSDIAKDKGKEKEKKKKKKKDKGEAAIIRGTETNGAQVVKAKEKKSKSTTETEKTGNGKIAQPLQEKKKRKASELASTDKEVDPKLKKKKRKTEASMDNNPPAVSDKDTPIPDRINQLPSEISSIHPSRIPNFANSSTFADNGLSFGSLPKDSPRIHHKLDRTNNPSKRTKQKSNSRRISKNVKENGGRR